LVKTVDYDFWHAHFGGAHDILGQNLVILAVGAIACAHSTSMANPYVHPEVPAGGLVPA
jgi:hypothetical protein